MDVMERPLKEQGFRNASSDGKGPRLAPVRQSDLPAPLLELLRSSLPVILRPDRREGAEEGERVWTAECTPGANYLDIRFTTGAHARVPAEIARAVVRLVPKQGSLTGKFSSQVELSDGSRVDAWTLSVVGGEIVGCFDDDATHAVLLEREFAQYQDPTVATLPPELFPLLGGAYEVDLKGLHMVFTGEGNQRMGRVGSMTDEVRNYRVRVQGACVHLHSVDDPQQDGFELSWKDGFRLHRLGPALVPEHVTVHEDEVFVILDHTSLDVRQALADRGITIKEDSESDYKFELTGNGIRVLLRNMSSTRLQGGASVMRRALPYLRLALSAEVDMVWREVETNSIELRFNRGLLNEGDVTKMLSGIARYSGGYLPFSMEFTDKEIRMVGVASTMMDLGSSIQKKLHCDWAL
jgi:hypothetical protein